jgi:hypothetical protein
VAYIGNSPQETTVLRLEARKSFALSVWVRDANGRPLDISTTELRLVMKKLPEDASNLIVNDVAETVDAVDGFARFNLQATDLDQVAGEYPFALVMTVDGYSSVVAKGIVDLQQNTDYTSLNSSYLPANTPAGVTLTVGEQSSLTLLTGQILAPGTTSFTDGDKAKLDGVQPGAQVNVEADWFSEEGQPGYIRNRPLFGSAAFHDIEELSGLPAGGAPGEVLVKRTSNDRDVIWQQPTSGGGGSTLPATGVAAGYVPTATGAGGWAWAQVIAGVQSVNGQQGAVSLTLNDLADTATRLALTAAERALLTQLAGGLSYTSLTDKPALGTASTLNTEEVLQPGEVSAADVTTGVLDPERIPSVSSLPGFRSGTAAPSGGFDGELYFQYT